MQNQHIGLLNTVKDEVLAHCETAHASAQILIASAAKMRIRGEKVEAPCKSIQEAICHFNTAAPLRNVIPDVIEFGLWRPRTGGEPSAACVLFCQQPRTSALLNFIRKIQHGLLGDNPAFAARKRSLGKLNCGQKLRTGALSAFPQSQSLADHFSFIMKAARLNGPTSECFLIE